MVYRTAGPGKVCCPESSVSSTTPSALQPERSCLSSLHHGSASVGLWVSLFHDSVRTVPNVRGRGPVFTRQVLWRGIRFGLLHRRKLPAVRQANSSGYGRSDVSPWPQECIHGSSWLWRLSTAPPPHLALALTGNATEARWGVSSASPTSPWFPAGIPWRSTFYIRCFALLCFHRISK